MNKRISIIIPVYNHEDELRDCLKALNAQTQKPFEVIIVDDGSDTPIVLPAEAHGLETELIRMEKNTGAPKARNTGFKKSTGEYLMFLDADAVLAPDALESLAHTLDASDVDFAYAGFHWGKKIFMSQTFDIEALKKENYIHTSALIKREAFPGFDETLTKFQDWDLFLTMAERGKRGRYIPRLLFTVKPRKMGISRWLPSIVYDLPWQALSFQPKIIQRYEEAKGIIVKKHGLAKIDTTLANSISILFLLIVIFEAVSLAVVSFPIVNSFFAILFTIALFFVTLKKPELGFAIVVTELMIGGKGALFTFMANAENNGGLSIRMLFFAAFLLAWALTAPWKSVAASSKRWFLKRWEYLALATLLLWGFVYGLIRHNPFVLQDANAWGFFLLLIPSLDLAWRYGKKMTISMFAAISAGMGYVTLKTLALFYLFSHPIGTGVEVIYYWLRKTGVGEVTRILEGASAERIFFQSHIFEVVALVPILFLIFFTKEKKSWWKIGFTLCFATVLISFSRSFWIAAAVTLGVGYIFLLVSRENIASWLSISKRSASLVLASIGLVLIALFFPLPPPDHVGLSDTLFARLHSDESALRSRWQLLPVLWQGIEEAPIIGHGFGSTVTYTSSDPRVVQQTGGQFTTYSFEWGWLDFWFKFGILGIPLIAYILIRLSWSFWLLDRPRWQKVIPAFMLGTLALVHMFTPYLNHPLGFIVIILLESVLVLELNPLKSEQS